METIKLDYMDKVRLGLNPDEEYKVEIKRGGNNIAYLNGVRLELKKEPTRQELRANLFRFIGLWIFVYLVVLAVYKIIK